MEQCDDIQTEEQLKEQHTLVRKVIKRLITKDQILIIVDDGKKRNGKNGRGENNAKVGAGDTTSKAEEEKKDDDENVLLAVHPNVPRDFSVHSASR